MVVLATMTPSSGMCKPFLLLLILGFVSGQQEDSWTNYLYDLLTVSGLREDTPIGTKLGTLSYSISSPVRVVFSTNSAYFNVTEETGDVTLKQPLSYKNEPTFYVAFYARDLRLGFSKEIVVLVNVRPVNHPPLFDIDRYEVSVKEDVPIGTTVYNMLYVTDIDTGTNGTITFECVPDPTDPQGAQTCQTFSITKETVAGKDGSYLGVVTTLRSLARTNITKYNVNIVAKDGGSPPLTDTATLVVNVESQYDLRPIFINTPIILLVNESTPSTADLGSVQAKSGNSTTKVQLTFMTTEDTKGWFYLESPTFNQGNGISSAKIRTNGNINRAAITSEQYLFKIIAVEMLTGQLSVSSETTVQVIVQDTNSFAPTFQSPTYTTYMTEGLGIGAIIPGLSMVCTDKDLGDNANFDVTITSVDPRPVPDIFLVQPTNGQGTVTVSLIANKPEYLRYDDPTRRKYMIQITAREGKTKEGNSGTTMVTVNVLSRNTNPPTFTRVEYLTSLVDNRNVFSLVSDQVQATDPDSGEAGRLTYSIVPGPNSDYFQIDPSSALITLAKKVSYNTTGQYIILTIKATDQTNLNATTQLRIQVIDSSHSGPKFNPEVMDVVVIEGQMDLKPPARFGASPLERDRMISYRFVGGDPSIFGLNVTDAPKPGDPPTGLIIMKRPVDYNETPNRTGTFEVTIEARSSGGPTDQYSNLTIRINVQDTNNHAPVCNPNYTTVQLTELDAINHPGIFITKINATDDDSITSNNSKIHFLIGGGSRDNFVIDYTTGMISLASQANLTIDRFGNQYNITVFAIDEGSPPLTGTAMVYVTITDSVFRPPVFDQETYMYYVIENTTMNTIIGNVTARSPDRRAKLVYYIPPESITALDKDNRPVNSSTGSLNFTTWFRVDPTNGSVIVSGKLSYDIAARVDFKVVANVTNPDNATTNPIPPDTANVTVFILQPVQNTDVVTFQVPINRQVTVTIPNNLPVGTVLFPEMVAYHLQTQKRITNFTVSTTRNETLGYINVNSQTGTITLAQYLKNLPLTLPMNLTYTVTATADPPSTASEKATVIITVVSSDADIPTFGVRNYNFTIFNNVSMSDVVGTIEAKLPQGTGPIVYNLEGFNVADFYIDNKTGTIRVNNPDNVKMSEQYGFLGIASVQGAPQSKRATVVVNVYVIHWFNNFPPQFQPPTTFYTVDRIPVNSAIGQVYARSPDVYYIPSMTYAVAGGDGMGYFRIDPMTGAISTNKTLIARSLPYILNVSATSNGQPPRTSYTNVQIYVANISTPDSMGFYVPEEDNKHYYAYENRSSEVFLQVKGYSNRINANITYSLNIPGYSGPPIFFIDPVTGGMTTNGSLDRLNPTKTVCIVMTDNVSPSVNISRCISITMASDQPPSFDLCIGLNTTLEASIKEKEDENSYVTTVQACSLDMPPNDTDMIYTITGGNDPMACYGGKSPFKIDPISGNITTVVKLFWNCTDKVTLNVTVTRRNGSMAGEGATKQVIIYIDPIDDSGPSFDASQNGTCQGVGTSVNTGILDFIPAGTEFIQMYAGDCDAPVYGKHNYSLDPKTILFHDSLNQNSVSNVPNAFLINPITGNVSTNLADYRMYSYGYFTMTITATDDKQRSATAILTVFIVREGQRLKFVFNRNPSNIRPIARTFLDGTNNFLSMYNRRLSASGAILNSHVDQNAFYYFNMTDMCFQVIEDNKVLSVDEAIPLFPPETQVAFKDQMKNLYAAYDVEGGPKACYVKTTTHWWSGYWFLWWLLIALALFIFVVALILNILACCFWPVYTRGYLKNRPYIVLDEPPVPRSPVSDFGEWQESSHRFN